MPPKKRTTIKKEETQDYSNLVFSHHTTSIKREQDGEFAHSDLSSEYSPSPMKRQKATGIPGPKGPSMQLKAIKAREKALEDKLVAVQSMIRTPLEKGEGVVVDCLYLANEKAAPMEKSYDYTHLLRLRSDRPFILVKQAMLTEGSYKDHVAIILKQSLPLPILKLPISVRMKVFNYVLKDESETLALKLTQGCSRIAYAPDFYSPNNLALLSTCKQIRQEAAPIVYSGHKFQFAGTQVAATFLLQIGHFRLYVRSLEMDTYNGLSARTVFRLLQDCQKIEHVKFNHISSNESPQTAIKNMYNHAESWLCVPDTKNPTKRLDILKFDSAAFHMRAKDADGDLTVVQWSDRDKVEFQRGLRLKLVAYADKHSSTAV